jgi:HlyD family secretion protein
LEQQVFGIAWLAIARTEEIVVAKGSIRASWIVQDIQMPVGGVVDDILVEEGDSVRRGRF